MMSLGNMRCDRCGELEIVLFRAGPLGLSEVPWFCEDCLCETGHAPDEDLKRISRILKQLNEHNDGDTI